MFRYGKIIDYRESEGWGFILLRKDSKPPGESKDGMSSYCSDKGGKRGNKVFFHVKNGREFEASPDGPQFSNMRCRTPAVGDQVVFIKEKKERGPTASQWGYYSSFEACGANAADEPDRVYQFWKQTKTADGAFEDPVLLWEGRDLHSLPKELQKPRNPLNDKLRPEFYDRQSACHHHWFLVSRKQGGFQECQDPRPLV